MPDPKVSYAPIKRGGTINIDKINVRTPTKMLPYSYNVLPRDWFLLRGAPVSVVTFGVLGGAGLLLLAWQKSANSHRTLISMKWPKVALYTLIYTAQIYLWFAGLSRLRSTRTLILTQFSEIWNIPFITCLLRNNTSLDSTLTVKGANYTTLTLILSFFVDLIYVLSTNSKPSIPLSQDMETIIDASYFENHSIGSLVIGYLSILCSIGLSGYKQTLGKKLAVDVGGNRRLLAISVPLGALMISPLAFVQYLMYSTSYLENIKHEVVACGGLGAGLIISDYFVGHSIGIKASTLSHVTAGWPISIASSIFLGLFYFYEEFSILDIMLAGIMFLGIYNLISADTRYANETHFLSPGVGSSAFELPLHGSANSTIHALRGFGILENISSYIKIILDNHDSRQIFYFLLLNLSYMFVQMVYGIWTNSLGLISDAIHMFFDCLALAVGLFAAIMSKWPENNKFTYGYGRIETLSGFANGIFLILISIFIMFEAIGRLIDPPEMNTDRLLLVSFLGFVVNLVGILAFNHGHHHGHHHGHSYSHEHGDDHDHNNVNHKNHHHSPDANHSSLHHHHHHHEHGDNANMEGIYLHILADTLGSIGVIISTLLINQFGWTGFDPLASILIATLIFMSVVPLVKHSAAVLMLSISDNLEYRITEGLHELLHVDGIISYTMPRFWPNDGQCLIGSIHIQIKDQFEEQFIINEVTRVLKSHIIGLAELTIQ
ncbi:8246_t:CDS:10 [Funneliformis geosporum]|uniref:17677_t:CDS:1 n=1 Tax=Funneliformis geosporum TaxID=1117311 RepID=A0A9W4SHC2_9GLOM|nr:8246_t:CDS:10 [Funneliformis geosporum]CAI2168558.1 17677_t:CDS:10 [Funneliformis geosporum]